TDDGGGLVGTVSRADVKSFVSSVTARASQNVQLGDIMKSEPLIAHPDEPLRIVANRMAASGHTRFPLITRRTDRQQLALTGLDARLKARSQALQHEHPLDHENRLIIPQSQSAVPRNHSE